MSRSVRFFEILQLLRSADVPVTAREMAIELEVTTRTIYRDIASLQASGLPISGEAGIGYMLRAGFDLPPLMFSPEELEAISIGLSLIGRTGDKALEKAARSVAGKIGSVLPDDADINPPHHTSGWNNIATGIVDPGKMRSVIRDARKLSLEYLDADGQLTRRVILPIALIYYIDVLVIAAWCELRQDFRHFRLDRILAFTILEENHQPEQTNLRTRWEAMQLQ